MKKCLAAIVACLLSLAGAFSQDFTASDALHDGKKLADELAILKPLFKPADPQAVVAYRIIRAMQQLAVDTPASAGKEKIAKFDAAIEFGKPLLDTAKGSVRDRAKVIYWYAVSMSQKGKAKGVLNSLFMVGELRGLCDKAIAMDPGFGDPYYLKALIDDAVPAAAGGDKARMGALFAKSIQCDPVNIWYLTDFAKALKGRNKSASYNGSGDKGVPAGKSDADYALEIAAKAKAAYAALAAPSIEQRQKMDEMRAAGL